jgi:hypothetical protein
MERRRKIKVFIGQNKDQLKDLVEMFQISEIFSYTSGKHFINCSKSVVVIIFQLMGLDSNQSVVVRCGISDQSKWISSNIDVMKLFYVQVIISH